MKLYKQRGNVTIYHMLANVYFGGVVWETYYSPKPKSPFKIVQEISCVRDSLQIARIPAPFSFAGD